MWAARGILWRLGCKSAKSVVVHYCHCTKKSHFNGLFSENPQVHLRACALFTQLYGAHVLSLSRFCSYKMVQETITCRVPSTICGAKNKQHFSKNDCVSSEWCCATKNMFPLLVSSYSKMHGGGCPTFWQVYFNCTRWTVTEPSPLLQRLLSSIRQLGLMVFHYFRWVLL